MRAHQTARDQTQGSAILPEPRKPPRSFSRAYLASWAVLGSVSAAYIAVLLTQPDWATPLTTESLPAEPAPVIPPVVQQLTDEVGSLRKTVADLQRELEEVKSTTAVQQEPEIPPLRLASQEPELARIDPEPSIRAPLPEVVRETAKMEKTQPQVSAAAPAKAVEQPDAPPARANEPEARKQKVAKPAATPAKANPRQDDPAPAEIPREQIAKPERNPLKKVVVLNSKPPEEPGQGRPMETGSLPPMEPPLITFGPPIVTTAAEPVAIHLDAGPSLDALRLRWSVLHHRHRSALGELQPRFLVNGTADSPSYLLMAGPIASPDEAGRICALLRARSVPCSVGGAFAGQAL